MKKVCASEANMKVAFINLIPAIIYAVVITGQFMENMSGGIKALVGIGFVVGYMALTLFPYTSFLTSIASTIIFVGLIWVLCDKVDSKVLSIILKIITAAFIGLLELSIAVNMTLKN
ncbi:MAG: hypothetical protein K6E33_01850 [Lachnospiraceae bacterium]|nr:hypothetical protein [Lachnospiraceae bacterium]